jgi:hypothetical protein
MKIEYRKQLDVKLENEEIIHINKIIDYYIKEKGFNRNNNTARFASSFKNVLVASINN